MFAGQRRTAVLDGIRWPHIVQTDATSRNRCRAEADTGLSSAISEGHGSRTTARIILPSSISTATAAWRTCVGAEGLEPSLEAF